MHRIFIKFYFITALILVCMATGCQGNEDKAELTVVQGEETDVEEDLAAEQEEPESSSIYVHVCGQVVSPGVYELSGKSRLYEALEAAGGMTKEAAAEYLNQAQPLEDGQQVYVPSQEEIKKEGTSGVSEAENTKENIVSGNDDGKVSINQASKEELMTLSGIGEVKAEAIISYRQDHGGFQSIEELKNIDGIKDKVFQKVKDQIKL